jgi:hypothetical protein
MTQVQKLQTLLIDIWGKNDFPDLSLGVMAYHVIRATIDMYPDIDKLDYWYESSDPIEPDDYRMVTYGLRDITPDMLLVADELQLLMLQIRRVLRSWHQGKAWRGTLRLSFTLSFDTVDRRWVIHPLLTWMRKVKK